MSGNNHELQAEPVVSAIDGDVSVREYLEADPPRRGRQNKHLHASLRAEGAIACLPRSFDERALLQAVSAALRNP